MGRIADPPRQYSLRSLFAAIAFIAWGGVSGKAAGWFFLFGEVVTSVWTMSLFGIACILLWVANAQARWGFIIGGAIVSPYVFLSASYAAHLQGLMIDAWVFAFLGTHAGLLGASIALIK